MGWERLTIGPKGGQTNAKEWKEKPCAKVTQQAITFNRMALADFGLMPGKSVLCFVDDSDGNMRLGIELCEDQKNPPIGAATIREDKIDGKTATYRIGSTAIAKRFRRRLKGITVLEKDGKMIVADFNKVVNLNESERAFRALEQKLADEKKAESKSESNS